MDAPALLTELRGMGLSLFADGGFLRVEPRAAITSEARDLIRANKGAILAQLRAPAAVEKLSTGNQTAAELLALVERVAGHYRTPPDELALMKRLALADPQAAWECFTADLATLDPHS